MAGIPQHIVQRGNNRQSCFFDDHDRFRYLADLEEATVRHEVELHAWVLMSNHVHLLATPHTDRALSRMMQTLGSRYVRWFNDRHERSGALWEGRFHASLVDSEVYLLSCMRYIELNPLRANLVQHPADYRWSSFAANALGLSDRLVSAHPAYLALRATRQARLAAYLRLCAKGLEDEMLTAIRVAVNSEFVLGSDEFKTRIEAMTKRPTRMRKSGRPPRRTEPASTELNRCG